VCLESISQVANVVLAVATVATLAVLIRYAIDTHRIAKNGSQQLEAAQMPFLAIVDDLDETRSGYSLRNLGSGPAN